MAHRLLCGALQAPRQPESHHHTPSAAGSTPRDGPRHTDLSSATFLQEQSVNVHCVRYASLSLSAHSAPPCDGKAVGVRIIGCSGLFPLHSQTRAPTPSPTPARRWQLSTIGPSRHHPLSPPKQPTTHRALCGSHKWLGVARAPSVGSLSAHISIVGHRHVGERAPDEASHSCMSGRDGAAIHLGGTV